MAGSKQSGPLYSLYTDRARQLRVQFPKEIAATAEVRTCIKAWLDGTLGPDSPIMEKWVWKVTWSGAEMHRLHKPMLEKDLIDWGFDVPRMLATDMVIVKQVRNTK